VKAVSKIDRPLYLVEPARYSAPACGRLKISMLDGRRRQRLSHSAAIEYGSAWRYWKRAGQARFPLL